MLLPKNEAKEDGANTIERIQRADGADRACLVIVDWARVPSHAIVVPFRFAIARELIDARTMRAGLSGPCSRT
jgi:hypothetical protein